MAKQDSNLLTAIDAGSAKTCALVAEMTETGLRYRAHGLCESRGSRKGVIIDLEKAITSVQHAADNLDAMISDARPGVQNFSKSTLPELNQTVRQMRGLAQSLQDLSDRVNQGGIGGALGPEKLPDYKPGKTK